MQFNTTHKVVKIVLDRIVQLLATEPDFIRESARARLVGLTHAGPQIEVFAYFSRAGADWSMFLGVQEKIILRIMGIVESEGSSFANPVGVLQMGNLSPEKPVDSAHTDV